MRHLSQELSVVVPCWGDTIKLSAPETIGVRNITGTLAKEILGLKALPCGTIGPENTRPLTQIIFANKACISEFFLQPTSMNQSVNTLEVTRDFA